MAGNEKDPTGPIRQKASDYPGVVEGTSCTQSSFKVGKKAFLYIGMQGGRYKAMFKLQDSIPEAAELAETDPTSYEVGKFGWVTARFSADDPMPKTLWEKWLDESYAQSAVTKTGKKATKK
ncbi:MmcQ/YjbR family DNA-binding protein [Sulfidibacter corallicola]